MARHTVDGQGATPAQRLAELLALVEAGKRT